MTRQYALEVLQKSFPKDDDLIIEYVQEADWQEGDAYWQDITERALKQDFMLYVANV